MIVFLVSGLWHGASWHYVLWGGLNGAYQVLGECLRPAKEKIWRLLHIDTQVFSHKALSVITTFFLIDVSWIFFRNPFGQSVSILGRIFNITSANWFSYSDNLEALGLTAATRNLLIISILILLFADICKYRGISIIDWVCRQGLWLRWLVYFAGIFFVLIFGHYGPQFDASQFIYFQF